MDEPISPMRRAKLSNQAHAAGYAKGRSRGVLFRICILRSEEIGKAFVTAAVCRSRKWHIMPAETVFDAVAKINRLLVEARAADRRTQEKLFDDAKR